MNADLCKIVEDNFRLDDADKMRLLGAIQKLGYYENNPIANMQPCWKFVKKNGVKEQLDKIRGELDEVINAQGVRAMSQEVIDVVQGAVTLAYVAVDKYGIDLAKEIEINGVKNTKRGYYNKSSKGVENNGFQ